MDIVGAFLIGFGATLLGAISTGANLITVPGLIFLGLSPIEAIASSRLAAVGGGITVVYRYSKVKMVLWRYVPFMAVIALVAGVLGPKLLLVTPERPAEILIGVLLIASLPLLFMKKRRFGEARRPTSRARKLAGLAVLFVVMIYSTAFVVGSGVFIMYVLTYFFGLTLSEGNATGQTMWALGAGVALLTYLVGGVVIWPLAIPMTIGSMIGGNIGAKLAIKNGVGWVKYILSGVVIASGVSLLFL